MSGSLLDRRSVGCVKRVCVCVCELRRESHGMAPPCVAASSSTAALPCLSPGHHLAAHCAVGHSSVLSCCWLCDSPCDCCGEMSGNELGPDGAQALAPLLAKLTQLQTLDLYGEWKFV